MNDQKIFALDIGTRKVMGLIARVQNSELEILDTETQEHPTRSMSGGQIEDIQKVAQIVRQIVDTLTERSGERPKEAAIAVAGRNLKTTTGKCVLPSPSNGSAFGKNEIDEATWKALEEAIALASIKKDSTSRAQYSCVGYVVARTLIDGRPLPNPIGHYGQELEIQVLASFLPSDVLESQVDVLEAAGLSVSSITLEPIAALQAVVSKDLRNLDLALVDIGAGTSDIAFVSEGAIRAFGMVPQAGDSITERISSFFLLDFLTAEEVKRKFSLALTKQSGPQEDSTETEIETFDIFQKPIKISLKDIVSAINPILMELSSKIAKAILEASSEKTPQGILCVGGGSLTPGLTHMLAEALELPTQRVGLSRPIGDHYAQNSQGKLWGPETATPLGIAEIAAAEKGLQFKKVFVNGRRIFVLAMGGKPVTALSALVASGISPKTILGWPGHSKTFTINGKFRILKPQATPSPEILVNGASALIDLPLNEGDSIHFKAPDNIKNEPAQTIGSAIGLARSAVSINGEIREIPLRVFCDGLPVELTAPLKDRMRLTTLRVPLGDILMPAEKARGKWRVNGEDSPLTYAIQDGDIIDSAPLPPTSRQNQDPQPTSTPNPIFSLTPYTGSSQLKSRKAEADKPFSVFVNGESVKLGRFVANQSPLLADALRYVRIDTASSSRKRLKLLLNGHNAAFTSPIQDGAKVEVFFE